MDELLWTLEMETGCSALGCVSDAIIKAHLRPHEISVSLPADLRGGEDEPAVGRLDFANCLSLVG